MIQIIHNMKTGKLKLVDVPAPVCSTNGVVVQTVNSLVSLGTEKMMINLASKSLIGKAKDRPDQVRKVVQNVQKEGLQTTYKKVMKQLAESKPLGYSCSGTIVEVGANAGNFQVGDRVACAGTGYANHAEFNYIPKNLVAKIPAGVSFEDAAYTTVGAIALQGVRQAEPDLGDIICVLGLGLIGLITIQILKANGCTVIGADVDLKRVKLARKLGVDWSLLVDQESLTSRVNEVTGGHGTDATIITASTSSNQPVEIAAELTRRKGKVVAVGMIPLDIPRNAYYLKELDLRLSMSYGPGRYDPFYEERGNDYPYAYVRWTEQRNMLAVLNLMATGKLDVSSLTTHEFKFDRALNVYDDLLTGKENYIGILFQYRQKIKKTKIVKIPTDDTRITDTPVNIGLIGAGNYAGSLLYPEFKKYKDITIKGIATASGVSAKNASGKFTVEYITSDYKELLKNKSINTVFITTRHNMHAEQVIESLKAGKKIFVEKPLALSLSELNRVRDAYERKKNILFVGYNRRYSPLALQLKEFFGERREAMNILYRVNAGFIPKSHWIQDPGEGGGRIIGEVCHFVDLIIFFTQSFPTSVFTTGLAIDNEKQVLEDNISSTFKFSNGSIATIIYTANGGDKMEKEYIEIFSEGKSAKLIDFKELHLFSGSKKSKIKLANQDKGQSSEIKYFFDLIKGYIKDENLFEEIYIGSVATFKILESLRTGNPVTISN